VSPRVRWTLPEGSPCRVALVGHGATTAWTVLCACVRLEVSLRFAFFAGFKRDSPGCLGDPYGCPRQESLTSPKFPRDSSVPLSINKCFF
jgi:hypothetical protein